MPEVVVDSARLASLYAIGIFAGFATAAVAVHVVLSVVAGRRQRADQHSLAASILTILKGPLVLFMVTLGLLLGFQVLASSTDSTLLWLGDYREWALRAWLVTVALIASYLVTHVFQAISLWYLENIAARTSSDIDDRLVPQVRRVLPPMVYAIGGLVALDLLGISITPLIAGLGIAGIAVALALQPTLGNLFSGTYLLAEGELNEGDFVELEGGPAGFVVDVGWRSTKIRDRFNNMIMIPNSKLVDSILTNYYSQTRVMTVLVACGVSYDSDLERVEAVALEVAAEVRDAVEQAQNDYEPLIFFTAFGDSNIDFMLLLQAADRGSSFTVRHELIKRLHTRFNQEGIEINYPVRRLVFPEPEGRGEALHPLEGRDDQATPYA